MSLPDGANDRLRALIVEQALSRPGLVVRDRLPEATFEDRGGPLATTPYRCEPEAWRREPEPSPAAAEAVMTINGNEILIHRGNVQFSVGRGERVMEPAAETRARVRAVWDELHRLALQREIPRHEMSQLLLGVPVPPDPIDPGAPPVDESLRDRLVASIVQRAVGAVEFRDGFFDEPEDEGAVD